MKIIIAGAGAVGIHLAKMLAKENQDIILLDENEERLDGGHAVRPDDKVRFAYFVASVA